MILENKEIDMLISLSKDYGDLTQEYKFYKMILNIGFVENLSDEDYEVWKERHMDIIKQIILEDELFWEIEEKVSNKSQEILDTLK